MERIALIIPVYNQESLLRVLDDKRASILHELSFLDSIVFVDDASSDQSQSLLENWKSTSRTPAIVTALNATRLGQGSALLAGFRQIHSREVDAVATCDLDHLLNHEDLAAFLKQFQPDDEVLRGERQNRKLPIARRLGSFFANQICNLFTPIPLGDIGSSLTIVRLDVAKRAAALQIKNPNIAIQFLVPLCARRIRGTPIKLDRAFRSSYKTRDLYKSFFWLIRSAVTVRRVTQPIACAEEERQQDRANFPKEVARQLQAEDTRRQLVGFRDK